MRNQRGLFAIGLVAMIPLGMTLNGCGGGGSKTQSTTRLAPTQLYNTWRLVNIGGGFSGQGQPVTDVTTLTFHNDGTVQRAQGTQTSEGKYQVTRKSTFFGGEKPVLEFLSASGSVSSTPLVIESVDDAHLDLAEEANDGFGYGYERVP